MSIAAINPTVDHGAARFDYLLPHLGTQYEYSNLGTSDFMSMQPVPAAPGWGANGESAPGFPTIQQQQQHESAYSSMPPNTIPQPLASPFTSASPPLQTPSSSTTSQTTRKRKTSLLPDNEASDSDSDAAPSLLTTQSTVTTFPRRKVKRARLLPHDDAGFTSDSDSSIPFASSFASLRIDPNASPALSEEGDGARFAFEGMRLDGSSGAAS